MQDPIDAARTHAARLATSARALRALSRIGAILAPPFLAERSARFARLETYAAALAVTACDLRRRCNMLHQAANAAEDAREAARVGTTYHTATTQDEARADA